MKRLLFAAILIAASFTAEAQYQTVQVRNNSACDVYVSLRGRNPVSQPGCQGVTTNALFLLSGNSYTFTPSQAVFGGNCSIGAWYYTNAIVNNPPCGLPDGCSVWDPNLGSPSTCGFTVCNCGNITVKWGAGTNQVEIN